MDYLNFPSVSSFFHNFSLSFLLSFFISPFPLSLPIFFIHLLLSPSLYLGCYFIFIILLLLLFVIIIITTHTQTNTQTLKLNLISEKLSKKINKIKITQLTSIYQSLVLFPGQCNETEAGQRSRGMRYDLCGGGGDGGGSGGFRRGGGRASPCPDWP